MLQFAIDVDGLNIKNLLSFEYANRRRQLLEEAHSEDASRPNFEGAEHFLGEAAGDAKGVAIAPSLRGHVAAEIGKEAAIAKEKRRLQESKQPKGKGKAAEKEGASGAGR